MRSLLKLLILMSGFICSFQSLAGVPAETSSYQEGKITQVSLEAGIIAFKETLYHLPSKVLVVNSDNLPLDASSLAAGQRVQFWTDGTSDKNGLEAANVVKVRVLSKVSDESIYH